MGVYSGVPGQASLGGMSCWDGFSPKEVSVDWDHLMHALEVGGEVGGEVA